MWILIVNYTSDSCDLINVGNISSLDELNSQEEFISSLGYDVAHIVWYVFDKKPSFEAFRYDEETDDIYPIWS